MHVWKSEDNWLHLILSFHHVGPGYQTQVISLGSECLFQFAILLALNWQL